MELASNVGLTFTSAALAGVVITVAVIVTTADNAIRICRLRRFRLRVGAISMSRLVFASRWETTVAAYPRMLT